MKQEFFVVFFLLRARWDSSRFQVEFYKGSVTRDQTGTELHKLSVQSDASWHAQLKKNISIITSLYQRKKKKSKFTLEIQWIRATHGWEKNSDLIGGGMCQIVVELYVKVGQRTEGKYWFLGRFTWHVYPVVMTEESDVTFVHQDSADGDTNRNSDILKCLYKMKDDRSINFFSIEVFHELFRSSNHLLSKKPICQKMNNLLFFSPWISLGCVESCWD